MITVDRLKRAAYNNTNNVNNTNNTKPVVKEKTRKAIFEKKPKDSFNSKYRKNKHEGLKKAVGTIILMVGTGVAVYKNKGKIGEFINKMSSSSGETLTKLKDKFPNLATAASSLKKACDTPINGLKKAGEFVQNKSAKVLDVAKNIFKKKA